MQNTKHHASLLFWIPMAVLLLAPATVAQMLPQSRIAPLQPPKAATKALTPAPAAKPLAQAPTIVANVNLVNMVFSVENLHGGFVPGLTKDDFRVLEDGKEQAVEFFSAENALPLTLGLLLDTSPSQSGVLSAEQRISDQFFQQVIRPKDLAYVIGFDVQVRLLQDLTAQVGQLDAAVNGAHIGGGDASGGVNPGDFPGQGSQGATHLWDAIYLACQDEMAHQVGRKAIIVVTDGGEQGSSYTNQDALRAALDSNTAVFAIMTVDRNFGTFGGGYYRGAGPGELKKITEETGGRTINAGGRDLDKAFQELAAELRSQYSLGYHSNLPPQPGAYRTVKIELTGEGAKAHAGARVRARAGYFAPGRRGVQ